MNCPICGNVLANFSKTRCQRCSEYKPCRFCGPCQFAVCQACLEKKPEQLSGGEVMPTDFEV